MSTKKVVFVLGMHRSGTSALAGTLSLFGLKVGRDTLKSTPTNKKGYFENLKIIQLNDDILSFFNSAWCDIYPLALGWENSPAMLKFEESLRSIVAKEFSFSDKILIKDPRVSLLLPFFFNAFRKFGYEICPVCIHRDNESVIKSLAHRNEMPYFFANALVKKYKQSLETYLLGVDYFSVDYQTLLADPSSVVLDINNKYSLDFECSKEKLKAVSSFVDPSLNHENLYPPKSLLDVKDPSKDDLTKVINDLFIRLYEERQRAKKSTASKLKAFIGDFFLSFKKALRAEK